MKHLLNYSVYQDLGELGPDLHSLLKDIRCDGLEMLTSHSPADPALKEYTVSVHLPYATDWMAAWNDEPYEMDPSYTKYYMYGTDHDSVISTITDMINYAAPLEPAHGVIHACNVSMKELYKRNYSGDSKRILETLCEVMNTVVSGFPHNEPPFKIVFENLWWPGLRLQDDSDYRILEKHLEFEDWGICLDTGHLMNTLPVSSELEGIDVLLKIFDGYSQDLKDSISAMHFHYSDSWEYRRSFQERTYEGGLITDFILDAYKHISTLDRHLPYTNKRCNELVEVIEPELLIHELPGRSRGPVQDFIQQRSLMNDF